MFSFMIFIFKYICFVNRFQIDFIIKRWNIIVVCNLDLSTMLNCRWSFTFGRKIKSHVTVSHNGVSSDLPLRDISGEQVRDVNQIEYHLMVFFYRIYHFVEREKMGRDARNFCSRESNICSVLTFQFRWKLQNDLLESIILEFNFFFPVSPPRGRRRQRSQDIENEIEHHDIDNDL